MENENGNATNRTRRKALKLAAGLVAAAPLACTVGYANEEADYDVLIVGAGMAGLYAARELLAAGYRVLVLEASNRHGGRIFTRTLGETRIEMGAEEHYLAADNPIYDAMVSTYGSSVYANAYPNDSLISMDGKTCWEETGNCENDADIVDYWNYYEMASNRREHQDFSLTMAEDIRRRYGVDSTHRAFHLYDGGFAGSIYGTSVDRIGTASLARQNWLWSLSSEVRGLTPAGLGYNDALDQIWWGDVLEHVRLNRPVSHIDYSGELISIEDLNGDRYRARKVIVTASIGVLQSESIRFTPALPEATVNAYNNIGMGRGMKVALRFSQPFWKKKMSYFISEGLSCSGWIPTSYKVDSTDSIVMCYPMGNSAQKLTDLATAAGGGSAGDDAIVRVMLKDLDQLFNGKASSRFQDSLVQDWTADPFIRGSYSYPSLDTYNGPVSMRRQLGEPVNNKVFFAGEGTNNRNPSCVPGALQEGARAARVISQLLENA